MNLKYIVCLIFIITISISAFSQDYTITWQRTIGGNNTDKLTRMLPTVDGGMVLCGYSNSNISGDKAQNSINNTYDFWILKLSKTGSTQWAKTYGGTDRDLTPQIVHTTDSGYLVAGSSISPASGSKTENPINKSFDYWAIKLDKAGNKMWDNTIGGIQFEKLAAVLESPAGYFLCGSSNSTYGFDKSYLNEGSSLWPDYWIVKLNKSGNILWDSTYGSKNRDALAAAQITSDGGLILGGSSYSPRYADKSQDFLGNNDYWVVKLNSNGIKQWDRTIGGRLSDYLTAIDTAGSNGGYILAGYSNSPKSFYKSDSCRGVTDYWIIKLSQSGNVEWDRTYGGRNEDYATSVKFVNGEYLVGGHSKSPISGDKTVAVKGGMDFWTLLLNKKGEIKEQDVWGGKADDLLVDYIKIGTNEYLLAGTSSSPRGEDKRANTVGNTGKSDYWILRLGAAEAITQTEMPATVALDSKAENIKSSLLLDINPNPVKNALNINYSGVASANIDLTVYSNNGKLILQQSLSQLKGNYSFDFSAQSSGVYYVVLQNGASSITKKFVKN